MEKKLDNTTEPQHDAKLPDSGQLPPLQVTDKEYKKLMKALYPKDRSKKFRR